jgi:hypothetical protein
MSAFLLEEHDNDAIDNNACQLSEREIITEGVRQPRENGK